MTKSEARRKLAKMLDELGVNTSAHLQKAMAPVRTLAEEAKWWEERVPFNHKPSSQNSSHYVLKKHLIPAFGHLSIADIGERHV
jgi:integrase-like protein